MSAAVATALSGKTREIATLPPVEVEPGDTLKFTNDSEKYPCFEVTFDGNVKKDENEITFFVATAGLFKCKIKHFRKNGKPVATANFSVRSCGGGCP